MKYLNIILTIITILLVSITVRLINISALFNVSNQYSQSIVNSNQALIDSNHRLEKYFSSFVEEISELNNKSLLNKNKEAKDVEKEAGDAK